MLGKLLKYEFRATGRVFLPLFGILIVVSIVNRIIGMIRNGASSGMMDSDGALYVIGIVLSIMLMVAVMVVAFVLMLQRFSKNLIGDEGYLMFTLPVKTDSLVFSKLITSAAWFILSVIIMVISIMIMRLTDFKELYTGIRWVMENVFSGSSGSVLFGVQAIIYVLLSLATGIMSFYMCISLSMLVNRHRGLLIAGFYIAYLILVQVIGVIGINILDSLNILSLLSWVDGMGMPARTNAALLVANVVTLVWGGAMYLVTRYMLSRRLNLE